MTNGYWLVGTILLAGCQPPECPETVAAPIIEPAPAPAASVAPPSATSVVPIDLPKASEFETALPTTMVTVAADGAIYVGSQPRTEQEVVAFAKEAAARDPQMRVLIAADRGVQHGRVIQVIDLLKQGGLSKFGFVVTAKD